MQMGNWTMRVRAPSGIAPEREKFDAGFHAGALGIIIVNSSRKNPASFLSRCSVLMTLGNYTCMISGVRSSGSSTFGKAVSAQP